MNVRVAIRILLTRISLVLTFMLAMAAGTFGQSVLVADAPTSATSVNGNFGTTPALTVSANTTAFVKFDISRTLPPGTTAAGVACP